MKDEQIILIAEDNDDHVVLMRHAFRKANLLNPVQIVHDGDEAIAYLKGEGKYSNRAEYPLPDLMLLDLKMPRVNGFEVLEWIRQQPGLTTLRIVVLTSSEDIKDVNRAYALGANSFLVKPLDFRDFVQMSEAIKGYWLWMSRVPESTRNENKKQSNS